MKKCTINKYIIIIKDISINFISLILSLIVPKNKNIWIFGSWFSEKFLDNTKYMFLYLNNNKDRYGIKRVVWVTNNNEIFEELLEQGFDVVKKKSIKGIYMHLRAKYHVIDQTYANINGYFSYFSKRIQLWHGVGFKKLVDKNEVDINSIKYKLKNVFRSIYTPGGWNRYLFLSTSKFSTEEVFKYSFRLWENKFIEYNYPRNIFLLHDFEFSKLYTNLEEKKLIDELTRLKKLDKKIILYMPTYRNKKIKNNIMNLTEKEFNEFIIWLEENNIVILNKEHFIDRNNKKIDINYIKNITSNVDVYRILKYTDILITDYSSIYSDYLFIDKPIIFYPYDLEYYQKEDKGFLFDYYEVTPGDKVFNVDDLKKSILKNINKDIYIETRKNILYKFFGNDCLNSNMNDLINNIIKKLD